MNLSGPTSFAPIIRKALEIMQTNSLSSRMQFHILFIIADGKVSEENEAETIRAIIEASDYPLSIVVVGVGDGPWSTMIKFDDRICALSKFDNFQFVDYHNTIKMNASSTPTSSLKTTAAPDLVFGLKALMELPDQLKIMKNLNYI